MATVNIHRKLGEVWPCGFQDCKQSQTDKQKYSSQYNEPILHYRRD